MNLGHYLFSFGGRINRAKQWALLLVAVAWEVLVVVAFAATVGFAAVGDAIEKKTSFGTFIATPSVRTFAIVVCVLYLAMIYVWLAITTKRLHDRDKSAWWLLVFFVLPLMLNIPSALLALDMLKHMDEFMKAAQHGTPMQPPQNPLATISNGAATIISLWAFVELYCLRGTIGDNRYGPDPLAGRA